MLDAPQQAGRDDASATDAAPQAASRPARRLLICEMLLIRAAATAEHRRTVLDLVEPEDLLDATDRGLLAFISDHRDELGPDEGDLVQAIRSAADEEFSEAAAQRLQESGAALSKEPIDAKVLADAAKAIRERRAEMLGQELSRLLQARGEWTEEDSDRVRELHDVVARLKGSAQSA
jgi:hypothetical protein